MLPLPEYHQALERDSALFVDIVGSADLTAPVPYCPGWTLLDLAGHLGGVHRWALAALRTGRPGEEPTGPRDRAALVDWLAEGRSDLLHALRTTDPDAPTWHFGPPPRVASFWSRRQALETAIHLGDARRAVGLPDDLDPGLAADGVDEVVTMFFPRQVRLERIPPLAQGVRIDLRDGSRASLVLAGDGTDPRANTEARVAGPAAAVLLALWGRGGIDALEVDGDREVVGAAFGAGITP